MIDRAALQRRLLELIETLPPVLAQNRLMTCTDRDLALALVGMGAEDAERVLAPISPRKAQRVREERALEERRQVDARHIIAAITTVIAALRGERNRAARRSYLRPRRRRDE